MGGVLQRRTNNRTMGGPQDEWGPGVDPDLADPGTGLTPRERREVTRTWALVQPNLKEIAVDFFINLFTAHPEYQKLFPQFLNQSSVELRASKRLQAHASTALFMLSAIVDTLDDAECLVAMLTKVANNHLKHNVPQKAFLDFNVVFLALLREKLGSALSPQAEAAWKKTLDTAAQVISKTITQ